MNISIKHPMLYWIKEASSFSIDSSDLDLKPQFWNSMIKNPPIKKFNIFNEDTKTEKSYLFKKVEMMNSEEVGAWVYSNEETKTTLTIFND